MQNQLMKGENAVNPIDFVVAWVDGSDPDWLAQKNKYVTDKASADSDVAGASRFEDNGLFKFWFRAVERFAPWVNKVYFVTYGHLPSWLNTESEKLVIVKHEDFLPEEYRPTFNSSVLAINLHRIKGLSENFVFFNDDFYLASPCAPELFFKDGLPCSMAVQDIIPATECSPYWHLVYNDIILLNKNYSKKKCQKEHKSKWYNLRYGRLGIKNLLLAPFPLFSGMFEAHLPESYLKSSYEKAWEQNGDYFHEVSTHKFRELSDVNEYYMKYIQFAEGKFEPVNKLKLGRYCSMKSKGTADIIKSQKYKYLCINDMGNEEQTAAIQTAFETILPEKSSFEK